MQKDPRQRWGMDQVFTCDYLLQVTDKLDLTDLVNPAFLANKRLVEQLVLTKFPGQGKFIRLGY